MILRACAVTVASHRLMYAELDADGAATLAAALEQNTTLTCLEYGEIFNAVYAQSWTQSPYLIKRSAFSATWINVGVNVSNNTCAVHPSMGSEQSASSCATCILSGIFRLHQTTCFGTIAG